MDGYTYFNRLIEFFLGDCEDNLGLMNGEFCDGNNFKLKVGKKLMLNMFSKRYFWEYIGWIILTVRFGKKVFRNGIK